MDLMIRPLSSANERCDQERAVKLCGGVDMRQQLLRLPRAGLDDDVWGRRVHAL